jgi:tetratricopeptide (TPR) repeat protein
VAWAADQLFAAGRADEGRALAEQACQSDTHGLRAVVALANVSVGSRTQAGAAALERAIATTTPRSEWCRALGDALEELGRVAQAVAWTHRALTLRPGDAELLRAFFRRATAARDADRIAEAVDWALTQPVPARIAVEVLPAAFEALVELDRPRAGLLARRALDAFGPRHAGLRAAILAAAAAARDDALACTALERWIAAGAPVRDRASLYTSMAAYASAAGDHDGEARALARALREGAAREQVAAGIASLLKRDLGPDGELALCEARVLAAQADPADASEAAMALRLLGAARWDVAGDTVGAVEAWVEGAKLAGDRGVAMLGADLTRFGGHALAGSTLEQLAASVSDPERKAQTLAEAARASLAGGDAEHALALARGALDASPSCGSALEVAEQASVVLGRGAGMSLVYDEVAARALGRFGRRAAHHRGARFFEQNGEAELALKHAAAAFKAVPAEGTTFTMLARAARRAHGHAAAVAAIESVADDVRDSARKAGWLLRAAQVSGLDEEGARRRFDLLTRAALLSPDAATLGLVADAARELLDLAPAQRDSVRTRIAETGKALGSKLDGPEGARVAVAFAELSITLFEDAVGGFDAVERALQADGDIDEFTRLEPLAASLAAASGAKEALARCMAIVERPYANIGVPALKLMAGVADELGDAALSTKALVAAAEKEPDDAALVARADHAALLLGDAPLSQRLDRRIPAAARVEALRAVAAERLGAGDATEAVALLERALTMAADPARAQIEDQLVKARAGRGEERPPSAPPVVPQAVAVDAHEARPWLEVAQEREERADLEGAVEAYERAAAHEPDALAAFEGLARVAEALDRGDVRITALQQLAVRLGGSERRAALRRLAEVHRVTGDEERAASILRKLLAHVPEDEEADAALEAIVASHGDAAELAEYLAGRVERLMGDPERKEVLRVVRLRRAALLEQRLGLVDAARTELETVVREWPEHDAAMSYLADLYDRTGEPERAVKLWQKLAERADDPQRRMDLQMRLANGLYAMGEPRLVLEVLRTVTGSNPAHEEALRLRADVARDVGDDLELGDALDALSGIVADDAITRSDMLVEAAQAAARGGDSSLALARARRAARLTPDHGAAQLFARGMEYRTRGAGAPDDARQTIEELARVEGTLEPEDAALATFLVAEALDALQGGSAGMQRLVDAYEEIGPQPLLCLGLAERLVVQGRFDEALPFFERALAGNLLGLRAVDRVALAAADAARRTGNEALAAKLEGEPDAEEGAEEEEAPPRVEVPDLDEPLPATEGRSSAPPAERDRRSSAPPPASGRAAVTAELTPRDLERAVAEATTREARAKARLSLAHVHQARGDVEAAESLLWEAVGDGSAECADELGDLLERDSARAAELVKVRRHAVELAPGDTLRLDRLRRAALADQHNVYARALDHVLRAFDAGAGPLPPPPLSVQVEQPGMLSLLARHSHEPANEAMGVVWDAGSAAFARSMSSYALTGLERVVPGPATVLGRLYEVTVRLLDLPRIPLFVRRAMGRLSASVALLSPPSAVLTGETRDDTTELRYVLGQALAAALPQNVLVLGLPEADARIAWNALLGGFGPTEYSKALDHLSGPVAETLWQMVPARAQKQLKDLMQAGGRTDFELLVERARQTGRRLGMFLTGDFRFAARALLGEYVNADPEDLDRPGALAGYCSQFPSLADLYRLAVRPEYADARWHPVPVASQRGTISSGRFSLV